jgi:hypothetical protein
MFKKVIKRIIILLVALPMILLLLELGVRIAVPQPTDEISYEDIYTTRYSPALNSRVNSLVPGMIRKKRDTIVSINNDGHRDFEYPYDKNENVKRIAIVGSSVAFGFNLNLKDTFGKILEKMLNEKYSDSKYEVLLFGRPGFKAKEAYACMKDEIFNYNPDIIIFSFVQNNYENQSVEEFFLSQNNSGNNGNGKNDFDSESLITKIRTSWRKIRNHNTVRFIRSNFHLYLFTTNSIANILRELSPIEKEKAQNIAPLNPEILDFKKKIANTESWISTMNRECVKMNIKFAILMHPYEMQLNKEGITKWKAIGIKIPDDVLDIKTHHIMREFSIKENFCFIDIIPILRNYKGNFNGLYLERDYGHYSSIGHQIIADHLIKEIKKNLQ